MCCLVPCSKATRLTDYGLELPNHEPEQTFSLSQLIMSGTDNSKRKLGTKPALEPEAELSE
jgi:hypothetical protein